MPAVSQATAVASDEVLIRRRPPEGRARQPCAPLHCLAPDVHLKLLTWLKHCSFRGLTASG